MGKLSFLSLVIASLMMCYSAFGQEAEVKVGDGAPAFELMSSAGEKVSLEDYKGKKMVVLTFSRGHW